MSKKINLEGDNLGDSNQIQQKEKETCIRTEEEEEILIDEHRDRKIHEAMLK